jgi:S1-C subfamily serine protease
MSAHSRPDRRARRPRRALTAALLALPLVTVPAAAPAVASIAAVDAHGLAGFPAFGGGFGGDFGGGFGGFDTQPQTATQSVAQDATAATARESSGVVLIDTVLGYGQGEAAGTGLVLSPDGTVVTNHHVVAGATAITVTVPGTGRQYAARVVGYDTTHDVAVLELSGASGLSTVTTDPTVGVGEAVTAVGNAEGAGTLTAADGAVVVPRTTIDVSDDDGGTEHLTGLIEDSADVVSGDSGGALLDSADEVVGMNVAASTGGSQVTGYAIPITQVQHIAAQILAGQASSTVTVGSRAALGVELAGSGSPYVVGVVPGGAADDAGLTAGDTITALDGTSVSSYAALTSVLQRLHPGERVAMAWTDAAGSTHSATVTLGTGPVG